MIFKGNCGRKEIHRLTPSVRGNCGGKEIFRLAVIVWGTAVEVNFTKLL